MDHRPILLIGLLALVLAGCGAGEDAGASGSTSGDVRTVAVTLDDSMEIELSATDFRVGETVRFEVTNAGAAPHEFYLGDADEQAAHAEEMAEMEMAHDDPNGVSVDPGATETLEYTFDQAGEIFAGCHEPGHYEAGMVASLTVAGE